MSDSCVAIIPARGGSRRIPKKNVKNFCGKPIIAYSIEAALHSHCFDEVMVSTDDDEIAEISRKYGVNIPFYRNEETANDFAGLKDVIEEVLGKYEMSGKTFDYFCCILATAPFLTPERIIESFKLMTENGFDSVFPVVRFGYPIQRALKIESNRVSMIWPENLNARSQDLMPAYHDAGQFYWMRVNQFKKQKKVFADFSGSIILPESEVQDIDTEEDWKIAEIKYKLIKIKDYENINQSNS